MLEAFKWQEFGREGQVHPLVRYTDDLPNALRRRMEQMERIQRGLIGYCHAVSILLQIPAAADYRPVRHERTDFYDYIWRRDSGWPITVLKEALAALDAVHLLPLAFRGASSCRLPQRDSGRIAGLSRNSLLNVVAECLDRLIVVPLWEAEADLTDVDGRPDVPWWERIEAQLRAANRRKPDQRSPRRRRSAAK
jgi:hypothetical protein